MQFIYVLPGWEGSAADGRVLRDALLRPHGLKVPRPGMTFDSVPYILTCINFDGLLI